MPLDVPACSPDRELLLALGTWHFSLSVGAPCCTFVVCIFGHIAASNVNSNTNSEISFIEVFFFKWVKWYVWSYFRHGIDKWPRTQLIVLFVSCVPFVMISYVILGIKGSWLFIIKNNLPFFFFCLGRYLWTWFYKAALWNRENRYSPSFCSPNTCRWALLNVLVLFSMAISAWNICQYILNLFPSYKPRIQFISTNHMTECLVAFLTQRDSQLWFKKHFI